jgi:hypothetical protein
MPSGSPPTPTGGTIVDGTYFQTSEDDYNGQSFEGAMQRVMIIDQAHGDLRMNVSKTGGGTQAVAGSIAVTSPTFLLDATVCGAPAGSVLTIHYTATATTLSWVDPNHANRVQNFAKQ